MHEFFMADHKNGKPAYIVIKATITDTGRTQHIIADCTTPEARGAAFRLLSGQWESCEGEKNGNG